MLKARYFKESNFMEAQMGSYPSYTWRSLLWGRELLHHESRWCIGNGRSVRVYDDAWVPNERSAPLQAQSNVWRPLLDTRGGKKGVRAVIRDWNALKVGTEFAIDARWLPLIVESDSQNAIRLITQDDTCFAPEGNFVEEVRDLTVNHHLVLIAIPREANGAAYRAARYSLHEQGFDFWTDVGHPWLTEILNLESVVG
ncbi:hypothetical protein ACFX2C_045702 [Malus domestica]